METPTKRCPSCGGEFRPTVERCPDCGAALEIVDRFAPASQGFSDLGRPATSTHLRRPEEITDVDELRHLGVVSHPSEIRELSLALSQAGIDHWMADETSKETLAAYQPAPTSYLSLWVRSEDVERAADVVRGDSWPKPGPPEREAGGRRCPACGRALTATATECSGCGLVVGTPRCPECRQELQGDEEECPSCGADLMPPRVLSR